MWEHPRDVQLAPVRKRKDGEDSSGGFVLRSLLSWLRHKRGFFPEYLTEKKQNYPEIQKYGRHQTDFSDA